MKILHKDSTIIIKEPDKYPEKELCKFHELIFKGGKNIKESL
jgi:hypothetical protein